MASRKKQPPTELKIDKPVALIGMMGAGKTTVGRRLAPRLGVPFFDADEEIERAAGMAVSDLFASHGEESFRRGEAQVIARLLTEPPHILSTGGGAILNPQTRALIKTHAISVWLRADIDTIYKRAMRRPTRPLLRNDDPRGTLLRLLAEREVFYREADIVVDSCVGPHDRTVDAVLEALAPYTFERQTP